jgi:surface antigen
MLQKFASYPLCVAIVSMGLLASCESGSGNNEAAGTFLGAAIGMGLGALAGHDARPAAMTMGAMVGGIAGNQVGRKLDEADRLKMQQTQQAALESGRSYDTSGWYSAESGNRGSTTSQPAYRNDEGQDCRQYAETVVIDGQEQRAYGTACRQPDGSWKIN